MRMRFGESKMALVPMLGHHGNGSDLSQTRDALHPVESKLRMPFLDDTMIRSV